MVAESSKSAQYRVVFGKEQKRMIFFLFFIILMTIDIAIATEVVIEPSFLGEPDLRLLHDAEISNPCQSTREETVRGNIHLQVVGRPGRITNGEIRVLRDALVSVYDNVASQTCRNGYRHLAGARIDRSSFSSESTETQQFRIEFEVVGLCKGCSQDVRFLAGSSRGRAQSRELGGEGVRQLENSKSNFYSNPRGLSKGNKKKKGGKGGKKSKKGKGGHSKGGVPSLPLKCLCPPPPKGLFTETLRYVVRKLLDDGKLLNIEVVKVADVVTSSLPPSSGPKISPTAREPIPTQRSPAFSKSIKRPTQRPTPIPTPNPSPPRSTKGPTQSPTPIPTPKAATPLPTVVPTNLPTLAPTESPTISPVTMPSPTQLTELPTTSPIEVLNPELFEQLALCPFTVHMDAFGDSYAGSFPLYNIPSWDSSIGGYFVGESLEEGGGRPVSYSNGDIYADWETLLNAFPIDDRSIEMCIERLNFSGTGIEGVLSGDTGNVEFFGTIVSYTENGEETHVLIPTGCSDDFLQLQAELQEVEECPLIDAAIKESECPEETVEVLLGCASEVESEYQMEIQSLIIVRDDALAINLGNRRMELNEILIERSAKLAIAYARCLCSNSNDLDACLLKSFLDIVAEETNERVELDEIFDAHDQEVIDSFQAVFEQACNSAQEAAVECVICDETTKGPSETPSIAAITGEPSTTITSLPTLVPTNAPSNATFIPQGSAEPSQDATTAPTVTSSNVPSTSTPTFGSTTVAPTNDVTMIPTEVLTTAPSVTSSDVPETSTPTFGSTTVAPTNEVTMTPTEVLTTAPTATPSDVPDTLTPTFGSTTVAPTNEVTMTPTEVLTNEPSLFERTIEPSSACSLNDLECCVDEDCLDPTEICFVGTCIDPGFFRFTLYWEGDDDLDLYAETPGGTQLFFGYKFDLVSGGQVGEDTNQLENSVHVENIFFPSSAPEGTYTFFQAPFNIRNEPDEWTITIFREGMEVQSFQGSGISETFEYLYVP